MRSVSKSQLHGGPDDQEFFATQLCGIGCNRLAITDPEGGKQPYTQIPGLYVVLNGEIYNHDDLRSELEREGFRFQDKCDGTILPALYVKHGLNFAEYLDGMFSIAILDLREGEPVLILATDSSGIKPVYFAHRAQTGSFAFATEIPALLKFGIASDSVWQAGMDHYLTTRSVTGLRTMLADVYSLPPGSLLQIRPGSQPKIHNFTSRITYDGPIPQTLNEASEYLKDLLTMEVRKLSRADAKVCSVNSGGLDSSLLTALLHQETADKNSSFHVACAGSWPFDERTYARELAQTCDLDHYESFIQPEEIPDLLPKMVYHLGQPNCAPHALSTYRLFESVSKEGFRVALTGEGSDELFCGHERMTLAMQDRGDWISNYLDRMSPCTEQTRRSLYDQDYARDLKESGEVAKDKMTQILQNAGTSRSAGVRSFEQKYSLPYYILHRAEPLAMASGVEVRVPFCQPRIMDFSWKINPDLFLENQSRGKAVVYGAAKNLVPPSIWNRSKQPFTLPIISLMHQGSPLMDYVQDILFSRRMSESGVFDKQALSRLIKIQETQPSKEAAFTLWALTVYGVWAEMIAEQFKDTQATFRVPASQINKRSHSDVFATGAKDHKQLVTG